MTPPPPVDALQTRPHLRPLRKSKRHTPTMRTPRLPPRHPPKARPRLRVDQTVAERARHALTSHRPTPTRHHEPPPYRRVATPSTHADNQPRQDIQRDVCVARTPPCARGGSSAGSARGRGRGGTLSPSSSWHSGRARELECGSPSRIATVYRIAAGSVRARRRARRTSSASGCRAAAGIRATRAAERNCSLVPCSARVPSRASVDSGWKGARSGTRKRLEGCTDG
jgi:hypothetical protein